MWRLWVSLHFLPIGTMKQGTLRKNDLKKTASLLNEKNQYRIEALISSMLQVEFIAQDSRQLIPRAINWSTCQKALRAGILKTLRGWQRWHPDDEEQALSLLATLPANIWLKLDEVVEWLQEQASGNVISADWMALFSRHPELALHHLNMSRRSIFLLPEFHAVLNQQPIRFPAPGWYGAEERAPDHAYISSSGEILLPPDINHHRLHQLSPFCTIISVEQMITLQLDKKALQRMGTDKQALKSALASLQSLQTPLPQAVTYLFDKHLSQQPVAAAAATSMVMLLYDVTAMHRLRKTGVQFSQPFKERPEIVLLDASADAHTFLKVCNDEGIALETLIKPVQWITGFAAVNAWMQVNLDREDQWLEISYQKTLSSAPKQIFARIDADFYGAIRIQPTRKIKQRFTLLKTTVELQPKHVLRLRELEDDEISQLGLDLA